MRDPAEIAAGLTAAQKRAVSCATHREARGAYFPAGLYTAPADRRVRGGRSLASD